jgi:hypothetical protein
LLQRVRSSGNALNFPLCSNFHRTPYPSFIFKSSSSTGSENWSTVSPNAVVNTVDLQYHTESSENGHVAAVVGATDFDLLEEDPLEWLIETDCSQQYLPESSLPLFPFLQDDKLILTEPEDQCKDDDDNALAKEPQTDMVQDALLNNMVDPNVTMQSLFLPTSVDESTPKIDQP